MSSHPSDVGRTVVTAAVGAEASDEFRDVQFVEVKGGRVHVVKPDGPAADGPGADVIGFLLGATYARCGRRILKHTNGVMESSAWPTSQFPDEQLCQPCVASVPADQRWTLFEHAQPDDLEEAEAEKA